MLSYYEYEYDCVENQERTFFAMSTILDGYANVCIIAIN